MNVQTKCKPPSRLGGKLPITFNPAFTMNGRFSRALGISLFQTAPNKTNALGAELQTDLRPTTPNQPAEEERA